MRVCMCDDDDDDDFDCFKESNAAPTLCRGYFVQKHLSFPRDCQLAASRRGGFLPDLPGSQGAEGRDAETRPAHDGCDGPRVRSHKVREESGYPKWVLIEDGLLETQLFECSIRL